MEYSDLKWEGYFAMPNERNRERITYFTDEEWKGIKDASGLFAMALFTVKKIVNALPEKLLCNAFVTYSKAQELVSWSKTGNTESNSKFTLEELVPLYKPIDKESRLKGYAIGFYSYPNSALLMNLPRFSVASLYLEHTEEEFNTFIEEISLSLSKVYETRK